MRFPRRSNSPVPLWPSRSSAWRTTSVSLADHVRQGSPHPGGARSRGGTWRKLDHGPVRGGWIAICRASCETSGPDVAAPLDDQTARVRRTGLGARALHGAHRLGGRAGGRADARLGRHGPRLGDALSPGAAHGERARVVRALRRDDPPAVPDLRVGALDRRIDQPAAPRAPRRREHRSGPAARAPRRARAGRGRERRGRHHAPPDGSARLHVARALPPPRPRGRPRARRPGRLRPPHDGAHGRGLPRRPAPRRLRHHVGAHRGHRALGRMVGAVGERRCARRRHPRLLRGPASPRDLRRLARPQLAPRRRRDLARAPLPRASGRPRDGGRDREPWRGPSDRRLHGARRARGPGRGLPRPGEALRVHARRRARALACQARARAGARRAGARGVAAAARLHARRGAGACRGAGREPMTPVVARRLVRLTPESLLAAARRSTGLDDFGDPAFREPLERLLASIEAEARLTLIGRIAARHDLSGMLVNRLRIEHDRRRHPEISDEEIRRPLVITGLPRTGSTFLHGLLAQDPANRTPRHWELRSPSPPPERATYDTDRRIARAARDIRWFTRLAPRFPAIHPVGALLPEECVVIMSHAFRSFQFSSTWFVPSYQRWLDCADLAPAYRYHRRFLQHLQWRRRGERWLLKAPPHLRGLPALFATYPDANVVMTHRDPVEVVASVTSLHVVLRQAFSRHVDPLRVGPEVAAMLADDIRCGVEARANGCAPAERFFDVWYTELVGDALAAVRRIYRHFDLPLSDAAERAMRQYLASEPKDGHGRHVYSLADFGLDAERERERNRAYLERFGCRRDGDGAVAQRGLTARAR